MSVVVIYALVFLGGSENKSRTPQIVNKWKQERGTQKMISSQSA